MAKQVKFEEPAEDIPLWFLTYSDVITLLMTFFILLLTFATTEPESFERMQVSLFGGGGGTGVAGEKETGLTKDAIISRVRPRAGRITRRGSENQPIDTDTTIESLTKGVQSLEHEPENSLLQGHELRTDLILLVNETGVTPVGQQCLTMMARQMRSGPFQVIFRVFQESDLDGAFRLVEHLQQIGCIPQSIGLELQSYPPPHDKSLSIQWVRSMQES